MAPPTGWRVSEANKKKYMRKLERIFCDIDVSGHETMGLAVRYIYIIIYIYVERYINIVIYANAM
jgi:hypothetical protein